MHERTPYNLTIARAITPPVHQDLDDIDTYDSSVVNCLQDYNAEIKNAECKRQVKKYVVLSSQDIRFDVPLAEACYDDRQKFCANVPPGSARVIRCLTGQRDKLSPVCRATLFDEEVRVVKLQEADDSNAGCVQMYDIDGHHISASALTVCEEVH